MGTISLKVLNQFGHTLFVSRGEDFVSLVCTREYEEGDSIVLELADKNRHYMIQFDDAMGSSFVYITDDIRYTIPFGEKKMNISPKAFSGGRHYLYAKAVEKEEITAYRNLAENIYDNHQNLTSYPHVTANVETRGEAPFAARNAIDGICENRSHGEWPYDSWGINMQDDAEMTLDFGRKIETGKILLYGRADFPHDNWWKQVTLTFSDDTSVIWDLEKSGLPHILEFEKKQITWLKLHHLIKSEEPSLFPALSQLMVYGTVVLP